MDTVKQKEEMQLAEARRIAATRIAASVRGNQARKTIKEEHEAAAKLQAMHRGKAARTKRFVLSEAMHKTGDAGMTATAPPPGVPPAQNLTLRQLGLKEKLPKNPVPELRFLTFSSWWTEMGTKRYMELCFDLESELFQVILDKQVNVLDFKYQDNSNYESYVSVIDKDTKVMSMHLHEKLSGNQHAESLRRPHLQGWDLHVGCRLNILGRPTTLMQCNLLTRKWLEYHAERLGRIKKTLAEGLRKYETVPVLAAVAAGGKGGKPKPHGEADLRLLMNQIDALQLRMARYRPNIAAQLAALATAGASYP